MTPDACFSSKRCTFFLSSSVVVLGSTGGEPHKPARERDNDGEGGRRKVSLQRLSLDAAAFGKSNACMRRMLQEYIHPVTHLCIYMRVYISYLACRWSLRAIASGAQEPDPQPLSRPHTCTYSTQSLTLTNCLQRCAAKRQRHSPTCEWQCGNSGSCWHACRKRGQRNY